jgi:hypothetical protein
MVLKDGKLGIGTTVAGEALEVIGNISSSGKITGDDFEFNLPTDNNRKFKGDTNKGVRLQNTSGGWAMSYGFLGSGGVDLGGFAGHGGTGLEKFFIGGSYLKPLVSFFSGSSNDGVLIGHFDNTSGAPKTLTVQGDISASGDIFLEKMQGINFSPTQTTFISSSDAPNGVDLTIRADDDIRLIADDDVVIYGGGAESSNVIARFDGENRAVNVSGDITASGDISSSGTMTFNNTLQFWCRRYNTNRK